MVKSKMSELETGINKIVGTNVRRARKSARLPYTLEDIAPRLGIKPSQLSKMELGHSSFRAWHIVVIADHIGVSVQELLDVREPADSLLDDENTKALSPRTLRLARIIEESDPATAKTIEDVVKAFDIKPDAAK